MSSLQSIGKYARAAALLVAATTLPVDAASGALRTWNAGSGDWNNKDNWDPEPRMVPGQFDNVEINNSGTAQLSGNGQALNIYLGRNAGDSGALELLPGGQLNSNSAYVGDSGNGTATVRADAIWNSDDLIVGAEGEGTLEVRAGGEVRADLAIIGAQAGSTGTVSLDGSTFTTNGRLVVGDEGTGTLDIKNGAMVSTNSDSGSTIIAWRAESTGTVNVAGGSTWTNFSVSVSLPSAAGWGTGKLNITGGSVVESTSSGSVGSGEVTVDGTDSKWINEFLVVGGFQGTGVLNISGGGVVESTGGFSFSAVGERNQSTGSATVSGQGSMWTNGSPLKVGGGGTGELDIQDGGTVTVGATLNPGDIGLTIGDNGQVIVEGEGSRLIVSNGDTSSLPTTRGVYVGSSTGVGTLQISGGGKIGTGQFSTDIVPGSIDGLPGTRVDVDGAGSQWMAFGIIVGRTNTGQLSITGGGEVVSLGAMIGEGSSFLDGDGEGTVTVDGPGSRWNIRVLPLVVGDLGDGTLNITNGGLVEAFSSVHIGRNLGLLTQGIATVDGNDSQLIVEGDLTVADKGTGSLHITDGGHVENNFGNIGFEQGSQGTVVVDNATWQNRDTLLIGNRGSALLVLGDGGVVSATEMFVGAGGYVAGTGMLTVSDQGGGVTLTVQNDGTVAPGASPGTLTIDGNYTQGDTGRLEIELASTSSYDVLDVTGQVDLGGTLEIILLDGFMPSATDTFDILTAASLSGAFSDVVVSSTSGGTGSFNIAFSPAGIMLSDFEPATGVPGDHNGDGHVDAADYVAWRKGFGTIFDESHYTAWRNNFGASGSPGSSSSLPVPEPRSLLLLTAAAAAILLRRNPSLRV